MDQPQPRLAWTMPVLTGAWTHDCCPDLPHVKQHKIQKSFKIVICCIHHSSKSTALEQKHVGWKAGYGGVECPYSRIEALHQIVIAIHLLQVLINIAVKK